MHQITVFNNLSEHMLSLSAHIGIYLLDIDGYSNIHIYTCLQTHTHTTHTHRAHTQNRATGPCLRVCSKFRGRVPLSLGLFIWKVVMPFVELTGFVPVETLQATELVVGHLSV